MRCADYDDKDCGAAWNNCDCGKFIVCDGGEPLLYAGIWNWIGGNDFDWPEHWRGTQRFDKKAWLDYDRTWHGGNDRQRYFIVYLCAVYDSYSLARPSYSRFGRTNSSYRSVCRANVRSFDRGFWRISGCW